MVVALSVVVAQFSNSEDPANPSPLASMALRLPYLKKTTDPIERDKICIPLSAYGRMLDKAIQPDAKIFMAGMLGKENSGKLGLYYFLRNYLFPRQVEISLDGKAVFTD